MTTHRSVTPSLLVARVVAAPLAVAAAGFIAYGAYIGIPDYLDGLDGPGYDGLGFAFGSLFVAAGLPVLALAAVVLFSSRRRACAVSSFVLSVFLIAIAYPMRYDYAPFPSALAIAGVVIGVAGAALWLQAPRHSDVI